VYPFQALSARGITLELVPKRDGLPDEDTLVAAIARTDVVAVVISWVQFASGYVADLARIGAACRANGVFFIVDGIQGCGIRPIDVHQLPIDIFASGAQKWQLSPWGTGFVYVRKELVQQLEPHDVGWACMRASTDYTKLTEYEFDFFPDARRFEVVTLAYHDFAVANAATAMMLEIGVPQIAAHIDRLVSDVITWVEDRPHMKLVTPKDPQRRAGVIAFAPDDATTYAKRLRNGGVAHVVREGAIRLSPHLYNTREQMQRTLAILDG
jgi:selenocysteine lyase/cysteine desulfurase